MVYLFLAEGFEEIEAVSTVDILRRAGLKVKTVSINKKNVVGSHGITVVADQIISECDFIDAKALILPGGMPGSVNLGNCEQLCSQLHIAAKNNVLIAAICAAPSVFIKEGLLNGRSFTCFSGFEHGDNTAVFTAQKTCVDLNGNPIITANGPSAVNDFALAIVKQLLGQSEYEEIRSAFLGRE